MSSAREGLAEFGTVMTGEMRLSESVASSQAGVAVGETWMGWLGVLGVILIIIPKVNIIAVHGQNAGLRVDDFVIATSWLLILWHVVNNGWRVLGSLGYLTFIAISVVSVVVGRVFGWHGNILYPVRLIEYFTFLYYGYFFSRSHNVRSAMIAIVAVEGLVMVGQAARLLGGFAVTGYVPYVGRVIGLTAGPWEIGYVLNLTYIALLWDARIHRRNTAFLTIIIGALLILTQSRAAEFSFLVVFLLYTFSVGNVVNIVQGAVVLGIVAAAAATWFYRDLVARNTHLLNVRNLTYAFVLYRDIQPPAHFAAWQFKDVPQIRGIDPSWLIRSTHWVIAFKDWVENPRLYLTGLGFGVFGPALDGGWLRLLVETGFLGLFAYARVLVNVAKKIPFGVYFAIATAINMVFIDMQLSYKGMALLLFLIGYYRGSAKFSARRRDAEESNGSEEIVGGVSGEHSVTRDASPLLSQRLLEWKL